jgi:hypothetical protein
MQSRHGSVKTRGFLTRLIIAATAGQSQEFAKQEYRIMRCRYCEIGTPLGEDGQHHLLGVDIPCDAAD